MTDMGQKHNVIDVRWLSSLHGSYGVVAVKTETKQWKAYLATIQGYNEEYDKQEIAKWGAKLDKAAACGFFPNLKPEEFVY